MTEDRIDELSQKANVGFWKIMFGCLILGGGIALCIAATTFWNRNFNSPPDGLPTIRAKNDGTFNEPGPYYQQGQLYKMYKVETQDGHSQVVAIPVASDKDKDKKKWKD